MEEFLIISNNVIRGYKTEPYCKHPYKQRFLIAPGLSGEGVIAYWNILDQELRVEGQPMNKKKITR